MTTIINSPNLTEGLSLIGWRLKRDAEIQARKNDPNFECEIEPSSTSYAAYEYTSTTDDNYDPYANINLDLCLEVDAIDLNASSQQTNDDYDPYEVFMRMNTRRTVIGRDRAPLALLPSPTSLVNNYRHYNFADDDTPVKYPLAIGHIDKRLKQLHSENNSSSSSKRVTFRQSDDEDNLDRRNKITKQRYRSNINDDLDDDIAPTVTEMDMLDDDEDNQPITKSMSSNKRYYENNEQYQMRKHNRINENDYIHRNRRYEDDEDEYQQNIRIPARRGRPPSQHYQEDSSKKSARIISQFEEQHGLQLGEMRVFAPKLRLRISSVNVNWINLPSIPKFPNKVHH